MKTKFSTQKKGSGWDIKVELPEDMAQAQGPHRNRTLRL